MKTGLFCLLLFQCLLLVPANASPRHPSTSVADLKKEIFDILKNRNLNFLEKDVQHVEVDFLINARNQLVVLDVYGDSEAACEYVKEMLNYKKVNFKQTRQLTRYLVNIRLVKADS